MKTTYWELMAKHFSANISKEEEEELFSWVKKSKENEIIFRQAKDVWASSPMEKEFDPDTERAWEDLKRNIIFQTSGGKVKSIQSERSRAWYLRIAASLLLVIGIGYLLIQNLLPGEPGKEEISIADEIITTGDHMEVFYLPDSSLIWLNKNSTLRYSKEFVKERIVFLEGEAFFEVTKNVANPFVINTKNTSTKVLGTTFNLRAYEKEQDIQLVVSSGEVEFSSQDKKEESKVILHKGDKGVLSKVNNEVRKHKVNGLEFMAWKNNEEELKKTKMYQYEVSHPERHLHNDFNWRENLVKHTIVEGQVVSKAKLVTYKNIKLKLIYYKNKKETVDYFVIQKSINPGASASYKYRMDDWFEKTKSVKIEIEVPSQETSKL